MGNDYGGITTTAYSDELTGELLTKHTCVKCGFRRPTQTEINGHISRMRSDLEKHKDLDCPYCPENPKDIQTLNRHLCINKICKRIKLQ